MPLAVRLGQARFSERSCECTACPADDPILADADTHVVEESEPVVVEETSTVEPITASVEEQLI